ncbi:hypothetical protein NI454_09265 [Brevundimonas diminuta]|uniref:hypothetical protein n=1 Tax=Brevundimonas diminuta TaxID=293 RepID=UPI0020971CD7|nr:hypothetical protein [Brevundimonas diminuta]MCO8030140.1 hypothetical protein [Brevundimonas diminuta]
MDKRTIELAGATAAIALGVGCFSLTSVLSEQRWPLVVSVALILGGVIWLVWLWMVAPLSPGAGLGDRQRSAATGGSAVAHIGTNNGIINNAPNHGVQNTGPVTIVDPPLVLSDLEKEWVWSAVQQRGGPAAKVSIYGSGKASEAADGLLSFLAARGVANVSRATGRIALGGADRNGPIKVHSSRGHAAFAARIIISVEA